MEPYVGEIRLFAFNNIPRGWIACEGQLMAIQQNAALFSLLGTVYGGDGVRTFGLPDLRGRVPLHVSPTIPLGSKGGEEAHVLTTNEMPQHTHRAGGSSATATSPNITGNVWGQENNSYGPAESLAAMSSAAISKTGSSQAHSNMQPYVAMSCCIAYQGIYPSRG